MSRDDLTTAPLRPPVFHILLALSAESLHGLGIADAVEVASDGAVVLGPGTLYRSLSEMTESGLIEQVARPEEDSDPRRKHYGITPAGRLVVSGEVARLDRLLKTARSRNVLPRRA